MFGICPLYNLVEFVLIQVLYKSRCDNKLAEITERAAADKREVSLSQQPNPFINVNISLIASFWNLQLTLTTQCALL